MRERLREALSGDGKCGSTELCLSGCANGIEERNYE